MPTKLPLDIYLLDMGYSEYGDCIVCRSGERSILIDGGHPGDDKADEDGRDRADIPGQLEKIFGHKAPFNFDLLVVTHIHLDHTGCLPAMVKKKIVTAKQALVADTDLGYGRLPRGSEPLPPMGDLQMAVLAALREEKASSDISDEEIRRLLKDAAGQEKDYLEMLRTLLAAGTAVTNYRGQRLKKIEDQFADFGLKILGPSAAHLHTCARAIGKALKIAAEKMSASNTLMEETDPVELFRRVVQPDVMEFLAGRDRPGPALNNQSIVLSLGPENRRALLTGDMQFAKSEMRGLEASLHELEEAIIARGPYAFAKVAHHGSYNALNKAVLSFAGAPLLAISGGYESSKHPADSVRELLRERADKLKWARTDKNGRIHVRITQTGVDLNVEKGQLNDSTPNS